MSNIIEINAANFEQQVIEQSKRVPVLVDFWASWCQPCQILMPVLAQLAEEYAGQFILAKLNTEQEQALAMQFGIRSIPTVKLFKNGEVVDEFMGALPEAEIRRFLDRHIEKESDAWVKQAQQLLAQKQVEPALDLLQQAQQKDPKNENIQIILAQAYAAQGETEKAEQILSQLSFEAKQQPAYKRLLGLLFFNRLAEDEQEEESLRQIGQQVMAEQYQDALDALIALLPKNKAQIQPILIKLFDVLGDDPLVQQYRRKMMALIY